MTNKEFINQEYLNPCLRDYSLVIAGCKPEDFVYNPFTNTWQWDDVGKFLAQQRRIAALSDEEE